MINDTNSAMLMFGLDFCEMGDHLRSFEAILTLTTAEQLSQGSRAICAIALLCGKKSTMFLSDLRPA